MSQQQNSMVKSGPTRTKTIPPARKVMTGVFTEPTSQDWTFIAPEGKQLDELILSMSLTSVGTGTAGIVSDIIKELKAFAAGTEGNPGKQTLDVDGDSIDLAAIGSHVMEPEANYAASPGNPLIVRDPAITAAGAYYASWRIKASLPGNVIKVVLNTLAANGQITGITGLTGSASVVAVWTDEPKNQYTLFARKATGVTKRTYNGVIKGMFASDGDFNTVGSGIELETELTPEMILAKQAEGADDSRGLSANGSGVARPAGPLLITDPAGMGTTVGVFQMFMRSLQQKQALLNFNTDTDLVAVILSKIQTPLILEA